MQSSSLSAHALTTPLLTQLLLHVHVVSVAWQTSRSFARLQGSCSSKCTLTTTSSSSYLFFMAMAVAIDTARLATDFIPDAQEILDCVTGGRGRFQIYRISGYATILHPDSEIWRQSRSAFHGPRKLDILMPKQKALDWQADPDDDLGDAAVLHHLHQQAATVPVLASVISQSNHGTAVTTLTGSALSASFNAKTKGRLLSSFHRYSRRISSLELRKSICDREVLAQCTDRSALFPLDGLELTDTPFYNHYTERDLLPLIVWAGTPRDDNLVFWQVQVDVVDLLSWRVLRPGKRRRTSFNQFLQVSEETSRGNPLPHTRRFNGVRNRLDRKTWVAEMKPPKHKTKKDFGNFKSEVEAARAVDAAFHHYGRPELLNFPDTSLQFLSKRPSAPPGLDEKAKVKFVKKEAKLLLAAMAASSSPHSTPTNSLQIPESPRCCPSAYFRSLSEISSPFSCSGPDEVDAAVSQPQPWVLLDSICEISRTRVQPNLEILNSVQDAQQGWDLAEGSTLAAPPNVVNPGTSEVQSLWLDSLIHSPPAPTYFRSPSPCHFQDEIAYALVEQQNFSA